VLPVAAAARVGWATMTARPRIDLDGVALCDERNPDMVIAIFRYRTTQGLTLLVPESADVVIGWGEVESTTLDLKSGQLKLRLRKDYVATQNWLRGAETLIGTWTDRLVMTGT
jgi:hypothetical protein